MFQRCPDSDLEFSLFCNGNTLIKSGPYKGYHYKVSFISLTKVYTFMHTSVSPN